MTQPDLFTDLAPSRATDPRSSVEAGRSVDGNKQKRAILLALLGFERDFRDSAWITADAEALRRAVPGVERSAWSSRLAALRRSGLLEKCEDLAPGRYGRGVIAFRLTPAGRVEAERLRALR